MNKKLFTIIFIVVSTLANILFTILLIAAIYALSFVVMRFAIKLEPGNSAYPTMLLVSFVAGLIASFFVYTKIQTAVILKFGFERKFEDKWFNFKVKKPAAKSSSISKEKEPKKTVLPSSVLPTEEEKEEAEKWGD